MWFNSCDERETEGGGYMLPLNCRLSKAGDTYYISPSTRS